MYSLASLIRALISGNLASIRLCAGIVNPHSKRVRYHTLLPSSIQLDETVHERSKLSRHRLFITLIIEVHSVERSYCNKQNVTGNASLCVSRRGKEGD